MATKLYTVRRGDGAGEVICTLREETIQDAANGAAVRVSGERTAFAQRLAGELGLSGCFSAYVADTRVGGGRQVGPRFHVRACNE